MSNQLDFFNSTSPTPIERLKEQVRASSQTYAIYNHFVARGYTTPNLRLTTVQVHRETAINLNSVRRGMNALERMGILEKLDELKFEEYTGGHNHYYRLK